MTRTLGARCVVAVVLVVLVVAAACGGSDKQKQYVDALVAGRSKNEFMKALTVTQARCLAGKLVDAVGVATFEKQHITPQELVTAKGLQPLKGKISKAQAAKIVDAIVSGACFDYADVIRKQTTDPTLKQLPKAKFDCLAKNLLTLPAREELANSLVTGSEPDLGKAFSQSSDLFTIFGKCNINPNELSG